MKISDDIMPATDLKSRASEIIQQVADTGRPVVVTQGGRGVAVLIPVEAFQEYQSLRARFELQHAVDAAEHQVAAGQVVDLDDELARWEKRWSVHDAP